MARVTPCMHTDLPHRESTPDAFFEVLDHLVKRYEECIEGALESLMASEFNVIEGFFFIGGMQHIHDLVRRTGHGIGRLSPVYSANTAVSRRIKLLSALVVDTFEFATHVTGFNSVSETSVGGQFLRDLTMLNVAASAWVSWGVIYMGSSLDESLQACEQESAQPAHPYNLRSRGGA